MNIDKILFNAVRFSGNNTEQTEKEIKEKSPDTKNNSVTNVISVNGAKALSAINAPNNNNYTFLQNVNIPFLNVNGNLYMLPNGQKCLIVPREGQCILNTYFKVGSMNEPDNIRGISHFIEHNLFNGSDNLKPTEFVETVNGMGGNYNASTGFVCTNYFINSPLINDTDLEKFIKMHADMLAHPKFSDDMLLKEKGPVVSEIQMLADSPYNLANNVTIKNLFNIKSNSRDLIGGSVKNIENLTREDVINYYHKYYNPQNALTVVIGDVDEKKTMQLLAESFKTFKPQVEQPTYHEKLQPIETSVREDLYSDKTQSDIIQLGFEGPNQQNKKEIIATNLLLYYLTNSKTGKLNKVLRKLNLDIDSTKEQVSNLPNNPSAIILSTTTPGNTENILKIIYKEINDMSYIPLSSEELQLLKNKIKNKTCFITESNMNITGMLAAAFMENNSFDMLINHYKLLDSITSDDIMNAAKKFLNLNKASICVVHPTHKQSISFGKTIEERTNYDIKHYKTQNNVNISTINSPNSKIYNAVLKLTNPKIKINPTIEILLNGMLAKGTSLMSEDEFYEMEDKQNILSSVKTKNASIKFNYVFQKENVEHVLKNINMNLYKPALTKENFEKSKQDIKNVYLSNPKSAATRANETLFKGSVYEHSLRKIVEELDSISFDDVVNYYNNLTDNPQFNIYISGNMKDKTVLNTFANTISLNGKTYSAEKIKPNLDIKDINSSKVVTDADERNQADIIQIFRIKETGNIKDKAALLLLNKILGGSSNSRLFNDLREKQKLAYRVNSTLLSNNDEASLSLRIFTTTDNKENEKQYLNLQKALNGFKYHIDKMINENVTDKELDAAKLQLLSSVLSVESTEGKNNYLQTSMTSLYKDKYISSLVKAIRNTTPEDINRIAKHYLTKPSVISIVASKNTIDKNEEYLKQFGELQKY